MAEQNNAGAAAQSGVTGQLAIQKIYLKDLSFEAPNSPQVFTEQLNPKADVQFANNTTALGEDNHEVVLTVTVNVQQDGRAIYLVEVQQAGIFTVRGFPAEHLPAILATACPNTLFPFAREAICDAVVKGGFPQLLLAPVNFEILYAQEMRRRQEQAGAASH
ncbi:MAG: protein-export chaperone SecB [Gammaproteobacteria bacterium]|nr:protein-export chaperone SecB [Gammaproteobacteria bacterium]MCP5199309.1 protein-export chaperone SecB [Gammaproteobacteria bacterium]